jgi:hypothetical protein
MEKRVVAPSRLEPMNHGNVYCAHEAHVHIYTF